MSSLRRRLGVAEPAIERNQQVLGGFRNHRARREDHGGRKRLRNAKLNDSPPLRSERNKQLQDELRLNSNRQLRERQLSDLHRASIRQEQFHHAAVRSAAFASQRQQLGAALDDFMALKFPSPPPEPTVVVVHEEDGSADFGSRNFDVAKWAKKPRSWWR